jgi:hypothetical protein
MPADGLSRQLHYLLAQDVVSHSTAVGYCTLSGLLVFSPGTFPRFLRSM